MARPEQHLAGVSGPETDLGRIAVAALAVVPLSATASHLRTPKLDRPVLAVALQLADGNTLRLPETSVDPATHLQPDSVARRLIFGQDEAGEDARPPMSFISYRLHEGKPGYVALLSCLAPKDTHVTDQQGPARPIDSMMLVAADNVAVVARRHGWNVAESTLQQIRESVADLRKKLHDLGPGPYRPDAEAALDGYYDKKSFLMSELETLCRVILNRNLQRDTFRRHATAQDEHGVSLLTDTGERGNGRGRPGTLYRISGTYLRMSRQNRSPK